MHVAHNDCDQLCQVNLFPLCTGKEGGRRWVGREIDGEGFREGYFLLCNFYKIWYYTAVLEETSFLPGIGFNSEIFHQTEDLYSRSGGLSLYLFAFSV